MVSCLTAATGAFAPSEAAQETDCEALTRPAFDESLAFGSTGELVGFQLNRASQGLPFDLVAEEVSKISGNAPAAWLGRALRLWPGGWSVRAPGRAQLWHRSAPIARLRRRTG